MTLKVVPRAVATGAALILSAGCNPTEESELVQTRQAATLNQDWNRNFWPQPGETINVCLAYHSQLGGLGANQWRTVVTDVLTTPGEFGSLVVQVSDCPATIPDETVSVFIGTAAGDWAGLATTGFNVTDDGNGVLVRRANRRTPNPLWENRTDISIFLRYRNPFSSGEYPLVIRHEMGHFLGFEHAHSHGDAPVCESTPQAAVPSLDLTPHDPGSVMDECRYSTGGRDEEQPGFTLLDRVALDILYPSSTSRELSCVGGCFVSDGKLLVRENGLVSDDWTALGALPMSVTGWRVGAFPTPSTSEILEVGDLLNEGDDRTLLKSFTSRLGEPYVAEGEVSVNTGRWTGIASTLL